MSEEGRKSDAPAPPPAGDAPASDDPDLVWQSLFQRSRRPLFILNSRRRLLFVNRAWEALTSIPAAEARGLVCARRGAPGTAAEEIARALAPPPDVLAGRTGRVRRLLSGAAAACWDIDFFPLQGDNGLRGILGGISSVSPAPATRDGPLADGLVDLHRRARPKNTPEEESWQPGTLLALRQRVADRYRLDRLDSALPALRQVAEQVRLVSPSVAAVLILGEPGAGKKWLARVIHHHGPTTELPFAVLDCADLPPAALTAVLFGGGSAVRFGTVYLDNPGGLPRDLQSRLCERLSEEAGMRPRLIAGACVDLAEDVRAGRMLEELRCALSTVVLRLPPLRERVADLPLLVERMLEAAAADAERPITELSPEAWEALRAYAWPGNLRELQAVLLHAAARAAEGRIEAAHLPPYLRRAVRLEQIPGPEPARPLPLDKLLKEAERRLILLALERAGGKKWKAADLLEIPRPRLFRRMKALGLFPGDEPASEGLVEEDEPQIETDE